MRNSPTERSENLIPLCRLDSSTELCRDPIHAGQHPRGNTDRGRIRWNVVDNQRICGDYSPVTYSHRADDARIAGDKDMIADSGPAWSGPGPDGAPMMDRTVRSDFGGPVHPDSADMRYQQAWADISGGINVDVRNHRKHLSCNGKDKPHGRYRPLQAAPSDAPLQAVKRERPKSLGSPTAVTLAPEAR